MKSKEVFAPPPEYKSFFIDNIFNPLLGFKGVFKSML